VRPGRVQLRLLDECIRQHHPQLRGTLDGERVAGNATLVSTVISGTRHRQVRR
jgi:hypothetical protein